MNEESILTILKYMIIGSLATIFFEDFKYRSIRVSIIIAFGLMSVVYACISEIAIINIGLNILFVIILVISVIVYIRISYGYIKSMGKSYLGFGDILLWFLFSPILETGFFISFFVVSLIVALIVHSTIKNFAFYKSSDLIPLAGIQSMVLIMYLFLIP